MATKVCREGEEEKRDVNDPNSLVNISGLSPVFWAEPHAAPLAICPRDRRFISCRLRSTVRRDRPILVSTIVENQRRRHLFYRDFSFPLPNDPFLDAKFKHAQTVSVPEVLPLYRGHSGGQPPPVA